MKKKAVTILLALMMTAGTLAGCGNAAAGSTETGSTETVRSTEEETEESVAKPEAPATPDEKASGEPVADAAAEPTLPPESEATAEPASATESTTAKAAATAPPETESSVTVYTYTDMNQTMWAKSSVNVRDLPSTDGNKAGSLKGGQEVTVTGRCNETGWYRLDNGNFVSGNYLVDSAPVVNDTAAVTAQGAAVSSEWYSASSSAFIDYLNQKRAEQGLAALAWDSTLEQNALARAVQLAGDFSHNGGTYAENIAEINSDPLNIEAWYNAWYNSEGHRANMFSTGYVKAACAYYTNGSKSYVITVFQGDTSPASAEQLQQQIDSGQLTHINSTTDENTGATVDVYGTTGAVKTLDQAVQDGDITQEEVDKMEESSKAADDYFNDLLNQGYSLEEAADIFNSTFNSSN